MKGSKSVQSEAGISIDSTTSLTVTLAGAVSPGEYGVEKMAVPYSVAETQDLGTHLVSVEGKQSGQSHSEQAVVVVVLVRTGQGTQVVTVTISVER